MPCLSCPFQPGQDDPVLLFSTGVAETLNIRLLTSDGTVVSHVQRSIATGQTQQAVSAAGLAHGMYVIEVQGGGYSKTFEIIR